MRAFISITRIVIRREKGSIIITPNEYELFKEEIF